MITVFISVFAVILLLMLFSGEHLWNKIALEQEDLLKKLNDENCALWKQVNATTQLMRKKEEAKKPRDKNGRFARKVKA